jgi:serine/threonine protein phosphatase PrpC
VDASGATALGAPVLAHAATVAGLRAGGSRPNQDAFGLIPGVAGGRLLLASLFDGHGPQGHFIARHVRDRLPAWLSSCVADAEPGAAPSSWVARATSAYVLSEEQHTGGAADALVPLVRCTGGALPVDVPRWASAVPRAFLAVDADLCSGRSSLLSASRVRADNSGCTAVCALLGDGLLLVAAAGDSSAYLAQELPAGCPERDGAPPAPADGRVCYAARLLTVPHKPMGGEAQRVQLAGGRVRAHPGEEHIPRVWPRDADVPPGSTAYGLAVSRAFGDAHWKNAGVCAAPDLTVRRLTAADAFVLLCSDGVTDALTGAAAVRIAADALHAPGGDAEGDAAANAAAAVNDAAVAAWAARFPRHARDDITTIVLLLRPLTRGAGAAVVAPHTPA